MGGRLKQEGSVLRDAVETVLFQHQCTNKLDLVELRIQQALDNHYGVDAVLSPALEEIAAVRKDLGDARGVLKELWESGQELRWESN